MSNSNCLWNASVGCYGYDAEIGGMVTGFGPLTGRSPVTTQPDDYDDY
jgi:hypothetical protein